MSYTADKIRNVCLLGHGGDGKTSLAESLLYLTKGTDRLGKVTDGNTVCDSDPEEIKRQFSISSALAPVEYKGYKVNVLDTPGFFDFAGEVRQALRVCETGVIFATAKNGVEVGTEKAWKYVNEYNRPRFFYVSKLDEEHADFAKTAEALRAAFGTSVAPIYLPIMDGTNPTGYVDIIRNKAYAFDGKGYKETAIPANLADEVETFRGELTEAVAETDDELMEKFFEGEEFTEEEFLKGIKVGVSTCVLAPVVCGSYLTGFGSLPLLDALIDYAPSPLEDKPEKGTTASGEAVEIPADPNGPTAAFVFKTVTDQYGRFSFFKVVSGKVTTDMTLVNANSGENEKIGHIYVVKGKKNAEVDEIGMGDIGAVSKLANTKTNDTLCAANKVVSLEKIVFDEPCYTRAITPISKGGEEKIASGLTRLKDEDQTFTAGIDPETHEYIISGAGDMHIDVLCSKLKSKFGVDVVLSDPKVAYRETIRKSVKVQGKHKKQSGGHGQYGDVWIEFEPDESEEMVFAENVFGGSVPKNFFPAVEKGLRECMDHGVLAGYPVVNLKATLYDGSYHDVDSNELSFKMAARLAFKAGMPKANPVLLEPIGSLRVLIPDANVGDIMSDLNKRRGRVLGMEPTGVGMTTIIADVPMAEMSTYAIDLRSITQGRGSFSLKFDRYEQAPQMVQDKVIEENKDNLVDDDD
ncbi:MAG: elongation factor G [Oscillospiraceae bacterium]|nr:elongation factor G [Oscillospiraceae bacterium]